ncbi:cytochrome P450 [Microbacterium ginsengiterrae]|uniref:Cytochrome P450 n=1 Tax=Microbacterium ginsengiterrae TaxID=546115 RepID=A0A7W9CBK6_9MICO|nr:cytochrome P450 [Microbacterium ginsengiterrae]MBB5742605.1 cytochrome P450 [Microbacterium ginsengiterrae]
MALSPTEAAAAAAAGCPVDHSAAAGAATARDHHGYEPFDMKDPFGAYAELRRSEPVMYDERIDCWVVTRYADVKATFENWETFSSENAQAPVRGRGPQATRIMKEGGFTAYSGLSARIPPDHTRIRAIAQRAFTPRRFKALEPTIRENTRAALQEMLASPDRTGDFFAQVAYDIPTITILTLLGVDTSLVPTYKRWSDSRAAMTWGNLDDEAQIPHAHNLVEYWQECIALVTATHADGGDSLIADLVTAQDGGAEITDHEIASLCYSLLFAGHETTTTLIANCIRVLLSHREQWETLIEDPARIAAAVDEVLRFSGSIVAWRRKALADTEIGGVAIPKDANVLLVMGSANRDEEMFADPEVFDISRTDARNHLSFGFGIHYCLGNMLAKLQAKIVLEETIAAVPGLRLQDDADIDFRENLSFRVPESVPVTWEA